MKQFITRRSFIKAAGAATALTAVSVGAPAAFAEETNCFFGDKADVTILYTNDVHTYIDNKSPKPTYAAIAALKKSIEDTGRDVLLVDAGDHIQGTAYGSMDDGATIIELMNEAGYDLATPGNHEFDYGMARAKAVLQEADFPYVSCNFYHEENGVAGDNVLDSYQVLEVGGVKIPVLTLLIIGLACLFIVWFRKTKLGQDMRAVGQDMEVARDAGINVERTRVISMVISTVFAGFGMIIYLQNVGNFPTYTAHTQIGMFAIAALLVGGASVDRASIGNVFLGVILFHTMFIVAPKTGAAITGDSMIGEYFRVFVSYAVITLALVMYESKKRKNKSLAGQQLAAEQAAEEEASK